MKIRLSTLALGAVSALSMIPTTAMAQSRDTWQAASVASAAVAIFGIAKHDPKLTILGAAGAIYSASRASGDDCHRRYDDRGRLIVVDNCSPYSSTYGAPGEWAARTGGGPWVREPEYRRIEVRRDDRRDWDRNHERDRDRDRDRDRGGDRGRRDNPYGRH